MAVEVYGSTICMPQGDTGCVKFVPEGGEVRDNDKGIFTITRRNGPALLRKILPLNSSSRVFDMAFTHEETAGMKPDDYEWSFSLVRDGEFGADGRLTTAQMKHTPILKGKLTVLPVAGGAK